MMKLKVIYTVVVSLLFASCATILNGNQQKVTVFTSNANSKVFVNDEEQGSGKSVVSKFKRDLNVHQVKITTDGFKDLYLVNYQTSKSPWYYMSWIPFSVFILPPLLDTGVKTYNFEKEMIWREKLISINKNPDTDKFLFVKSTAFNIDLKDLKVTKINFTSEAKKDSVKTKKIDSITNNIKFDNVAFTKSLNKILVKHQHTDTTGTVYKNKANSVYISSTINKLNLQTVYKNTAHTNNVFLKVEAEITWYFLDIYGQSIYSLKTTTKSGDFSFDFYKNETVTIAIEDAITNSFLNFMNEKKVKDNLRKSKFGLEPKLKTLELFKGSFVENMEDALNSTVTVKVKNGHGSGFKVGKDGYVITNFNVVANSEDRIIIVTKDNKEYEGKLIRKNETLDLALIRVDATFEKHFDIAKESSFTEGDSVFLIATSENIEQGPIISKGIVSGYKENGGLKLIQINENTKDSNSGGPMINKEGKLLGIVNTKFNNLGIKGGSYAISAEFLTSSLSIK